MLDIADSWRFLFLMALNQVTPGRYPNNKARTVACTERSEKCEAGKPSCRKATMWDGLYQAFVVILDGLFLGLPHDTLSQNHFTQPAYQNRRLDQESCSRVTAAWPYIMR